MKDVRDDGLVVARHLRNDIYEVRATGLKGVPHPVRNGRKAKSGAASARGVLQEDEEDSAAQDCPCRAAPGRLAT